MISHTAEYCLRAVVCLAAAPRQPLTTATIAQTTRIPAGYLCKILQLLGRAGLVTAQRGLNGGFLLERDPATLSLLDVVRIADPSRRVLTCPLGIHGNNLCALHRQLDEAAAVAELALASHTIAQLMAEPGVTPLHAEPAELVSTCSCHPASGDALCSK